MSGNLNIDLNIVLMKLISFKLYLPSIRVINLLKEKERERERKQFILNFLRMYILLIHLNSMTEVESMHFQNYSITFNFFVF